jgi:putative flippase GtrA
MKLSGQIFRFGCIGVAAMLVHLAVVSLLVPLGLAPLLANVAAFAVAFQVSYLGHRGWTFRGTGGKGSYLRMLFVSLASFALNEALYFGMLHFFAWDYRLSLVLVLFAVASFTFVASRFWVFAGKEDQASGDDRKPLDRPRLGTSRSRVIERRTLRSGRRGKEDPLSDFQREYREQS